MWPGDTNNDGIVKQSDVLPIGLYWHYTGPPRPNATRKWVGQPAEPWNPEKATYADADGNGEVNQADVLPIGLNWKKTHDGGAPGPAPAPSMGVAKQIALMLPNSIQRQGEFYVDVVAHGQGNMLGVSFILDYDPSVLKPLLVEKGDLLGENALFLSIVENGSIAVGITRKAEQGAVNDNGVVVRIKFKAIGGKSVSKLTLKEVILSDGEKMLRLSDRSGTLKLIPAETALLPNYPNPFNPDTWIPFKLAKSADVIIRIYDLHGRLIRELNLGYLEAGYYIDRGAAAYWDGRNELGEKVSSGVYIYQMIAGEKSFLRKMVILK